MKKIIFLMVTLIPFLGFSQTNQQVDMAPRVYHDSTDNVYFMFDRTQTKDIVKTYTERDLYREKTDLLKQKNDNLELDLNKSEQQIDTLRKTVSVLENIHKKQDQIIEKKDLIIKDYEDISDMQTDIIEKLDKKVKRRNGVIKTLIGSNVITIIIIIILL